MEIKEIYLPVYGVSILVDEVDYLFVLGLSPFSVESNGYVKVWIKINGKRERKLLHRLIAERAGKNCSNDIDHHDRNLLNLTRVNLRTATRSQNLQNQIIPSNNQSGYKGVSWDNERQKWRATFSYANRKVSLGRFDSAIEAARAYDSAALRFYGEFARINGI